MRAYVLVNARAGEAVHLARELRKTARHRPGRLRLRCPTTLSLRSRAKDLATHWPPRVRRDSRAARGDRHADLPGRRIKNEVGAHIAPHLIPTTPGWPRGPIRSRALMARRAVLPTDQRLQVAAHLRQHRQRRCRAARSSIPRIASRWNSCPRLIERLHHGLPRRGQRDQREAVILRVGAALQQSLCFHLLDLTGDRGAVDLQMALQVGLAQLARGVHVRQQAHAETSLRRQSFRMPCAGRGPSVPGQAGPTRSSCPATGDLPSAALSISDS